MKLFLNLLILLAIMTFLKIPQESKMKLNNIKDQKQINKGPVYNPLRAKPYTKYTIKA